MLRLGFLFKSPPPFLLLILLMQFLYYIKGCFLIYLLPQEKGNLSFRELMLNFHLHLQEIIWLNLITNISQCSLE